MFLDRCEMLRDALDHPALTTDVIVGFPGETEAHFQQTLQTCREASFSKIHVFPFSPRRGTPAAEFDHQVDAVVKQERVERLTELETKLREQYYRSLVERKLQVLVEGSFKPHDMTASIDRKTPQAIWYRGTSCRYATVEFASRKTRLERKLVDVVVLDAERDRLIAQPVAAEFI